MGSAGYQITNHSQRVVLAVAIIYSVLFLFSCERKVDDELVSINLVLPQQSISQVPVSANTASNQIGIVESSTNELKNVFNSIQPSMSSTAANRVNCYLLVVSGPSDDTELSKNYCTKKTDPTSNLVADAQSAQLKFGSYAGLIDAFNYGGAINLTLKPGPARVFTLLGFHATNSCSDIFTALRDKSKLSKAYQLGTTAPIDLVPGSVEVGLKMLSEVDPGQYYTDCVIQDPETIYPIFSTVKLEKSGFPYNTFRSFASDQSSNYYCEPLEISLRATDPYTQRQIPGTVLDDEFFRLKRDGVQLSTYDTEQNCTADTSPNDPNASALFKFSKNQIRQNRWFKQRKGGTGNTSIVIHRADDTPLTSASFKQLHNLASIFMDTLLPSQVVPGVCYEVTSILRDLNGLVLTNSSSFTITNSAVMQALGITQHLNNSECESGTNPNPGITFAGSTNSASYSLRFANAGATVFEYEPALSDGSIINAKPTVRLTTVTSANSDKVAGVKVNSKTIIPNNVTLSAGVIDCIPMFVSLLRDDLTEFIQTSGAVTTMLPLKLRTLDAATSGYSLYSNEACTAPIYPVGSSFSAAGTDVAAPAAGSSFYKMYIKPDRLGTYGLRKIEFEYNSQIIGNFQFSLTNPSY